MWIYNLIQREIKKSGELLFWKERYEVTFFAESQIVHAYRDKEYWSIL